MYTRSFTRLLTLSAMLALVTTAAQAASITWGAATNITPGLAGDNDVSTVGTFVGALHFTNLAANTTVNGVTFTGISANLINTITSGDFTLTTTNPASLFSAINTAAGGAPFSNLSASYQSLLTGTLRIGNNPPPTMTLTMNNLVAGATYQFEWWNNTSGSFSGNNPTTATAGNAVTLNSNTSGGGGGLGQYALGSFVADATTTQAITFAASSAAAALNGFQLRQTAPPAVPEPGTALFGLALLGTALTRRARK